MQHKEKPKALSEEQKKARASNAAMTRWAKYREHKDMQQHLPVYTDEQGAILPDLVETQEGDLPTAKYRGYLPIMEASLPCYVLSTGQRVIGRTSATELLTGIKGGGGLEKYLSVSPLKPFINMESVLERLVAFRIPEVEGLERAVKGLPADLFIEICQGFVAALNAHYRPNNDTKLTSRQIEMGMKASMFLSACAKVGLDALIDEATGFQYERERDALQVKLNAYLGEELRKWEKTFPDELWMEFGRLTGWKGGIYKRPKYWGKLVIELVYEHLDTDVARWLKENAPAPRHGLNYHQWLSSQFGLKKLIEHMWMLIGVGKTCTTMTELRDRMAELNGKVPYQMRLYFNPTEMDNKQSAQK
jgi:hypothetical protein